jgi:hypothetical protein
MGFIMNHRMALNPQALPRILCLDDVEPLRQVPPSLPRPPEEAKLISWFAALRLVGDYLGKAKNFDLAERHYHWSALSSK